MVNKDIKTLPLYVCNQIAAGEVVERPASVVKELFENAIDAGANEISVFISGGGLSEIVVMDDGCGMTKENLRKSFLPHATSKLEDIKDLDTLSTLGFRGEAIASIASVSEMEITSKTDDMEIGYTMKCVGGVTEEPTEAPCVEGTCVTVRKLFYNTPARLKFMKTAKAEETAVTDLIERLILANSTVSVKYYCEEKLILESFGDGLRQCVSCVYGMSVVDNCYEISYEKNGLLIEGLIGTKNLWRGTRSYQTIIVNGRWIEDKTISSAVANAYAPYLMKRQYPFFVLKIIIDPDAIDVNVHPRKTEIRFKDNGVVYATVKSVLSRVLDGSSDALNIVVRQPRLGSEVHITADDTPISEYDFVSKPISGNSYDSHRDPIFTTGTRGMYKQPESEKKDSGGYSDYEGCEYDFTPKKRVKAEVARYEQKITDFTDAETLKEEKRRQAEAELADKIFAENKAYAEKLAKGETEQQETEKEEELKIVGQVFNTFLLLESGNELVVIDQHAAHERLLFDKFCMRLKTDSVMKQSLLFPYAFKVNASEGEIMEGLHDRFVEMGFEVLRDGDSDVFKVYSIPVELIGINLDEFFKEIIDDEQFKDEKTIGVIREKLIQKACKSAIKSGDELSLLEMKTLIEDLKKDWTLRCPHGRPIAIKITRTDFDKWFKRIV